MSTIQDLLRSSALPHIESNMLMQHATGLSRIQLISRAYDALSELQLSHFHQLVQRRLNGEPIAYILGTKEFYGRDFKVTPDVLIPRSDTETLIEHVLSIYQHQRTQALRVLDLGTGSGAIAITLKLECSTWQVSAVDISPAALKVAQHNATQHHARIDFDLSDWCTALTHKKFDLIVSNPPYIEANDIHLSQGDLRFEPTIALTDGQNGLTNYAFLIDTVPDYLSESGQLWFEHGYNQAQAVRDLLQQAGYANIRTIADLAGQPRVTGGRYLHKS